MTLNEETTSGYAPVNGLNMYYEIHGAGRPLILLHGGFGSTTMLGEVLTALAKDRQVIAVDLQAHGRTADIDRPLRFESMGDDVAALIGHLGLRHADLMGYSLGGGAALQATIRHPGLVRKTVLVSAPFKKDGWYPENAAAMAQMGPASVEMMKQTPLYQEYARIAPRPEDFPTFVGKMGDLLRQDYDWTDGVKGIKSPVLVVVGDADAVRTSHALEYFELLGGGRAAASWDGSGMPDSQLAILPGTTHYDIFQSLLLAPSVIPFLDRAVPGEE